MKRKVAWLVFWLTYLTCVVAKQNNTVLLSSDETAPPCQNGVSQNCEARTFGVGKVVARRRMVMFFLPVMFKLGVIMTLLVILTVMASKGLAIGLALLYFALANKQKHGGWQHRTTEDNPVPVHVHFHGTQSPHHKSPSYSSSAYAQEPYWERYGDSRGRIGADPYLRRSASVTTSHNYRPR